MTSRFSGDIFYAAAGGGGGSGGSSRPSMAAFAGAQGGFQQQPLQNPAFFTPDQIPSRRSSADLLMMGSKRSFSDFQSYHQQILLLQHQQQQQNQYLMRSVKPRTNHFVSSSTTRFGLPVYQQPINLSNHNILPARNGPNPEDDKILNTLQELEKQLLNDDDEDNQDDHDAVSVITNSEWSETFQSLMGSDPSPISPAQNNTNTNTNNNNNNNNLISPSPTSSTSSCCSTSGSPVPAKQLIIEAATAISDGRVDIAIDQLARVAQVANPKGSSEQRLAFYMSNALRSRACPRENPAPVKELYSEEQMSSMCALYDISPCFKFGLLAANLVMLEAIASSSSKMMKIHVVDFHVGHLRQYLNLVCALGERRLTELRITVVETELENGLGVEAESMRDELMKLAERVGINLRFESVTRKIHELTRETLGCEDDESVVVNLAYMLYRVPDESVSMENLRDELLRRIKSLTPRAVTLVEQDMNANTAPFATRVNEAWGYYGALLDSLEATLPRDSLDRARVEEGLGRKMANVVACEGRDRVERAEVFGKWRARMGMAGFEMKALSRSVAESMRAKLNSDRAGNPGFTVKEEGGGVGFGWMGRTLTVASSWR